MLEVIFVLIDTAALFFQGFSFRKDNYLILLISSLIIFLVAGIDAFVNGLPSVSTVLDIDKFDIIKGVIYCLFWWILGYIIGGFQIIREKDLHVVRIRCK